MWITSLPPIRESCTFLDVKNYVLTRITEPSNDDYDIDGSDICDHNFDTFDNFGVKNDQKVSHNMILKLEFSWMQIARPLVTWRLPYSKPYLPLMTYLLL